MSLVNYSSKEVTLKIVYYGPGLSGKTTNLQCLHANVPQENRGKLLSLATESDRTLFFDFMPMTLGKLGDFTVKFQLYTVPGQVRYDATRKLVLKGADAVVFVADSQKALREQNVESYQNMLDNLNVNNIDPNDIPIVLQYNKRDLEDIMSEDELNELLNADGHETVNAEAVNGTGVDDTFRLVMQLLLFQFAAKHKINFAKPSPSEAPQEQPQTDNGPAQQQSISAAPEKSVPGTNPDETVPDVETIPDVESTPDVEAVTNFEVPSDISFGQMTEQTAPEESAPETHISEVSYDESQFALRDMPSIDELQPITQDPFETAGATTDEFRNALIEITRKLKESQVEAWLEKLLYSNDGTKLIISELLSEVKESRKNQEQIIKLLKKIESSLKTAAKAAERA